MNQRKVKRLRKLFRKLTGFNSFVEKGLFRRFKKDNIGQTIVRRIV